MKQEDKIGYSFYPLTVCSDVCVCVCECERGDV